MVADLILWSCVGWVAMAIAQSLDWSFGTGNPRPPDEPEYYGLQILGVLSGLAGGWAYSHFWPAEGRVTGLDAAATAFGAALGAILLGHIFALIRRRRPV